jgi:ABC-2 type transport system permease protein
MLKTLIIGLKDLKLAFRDRAALTFMLLAPFLLTLGLGAATGRFSGSDNTNPGISDIPVVIVNLDNAQLGDALVDVFYSDELAALVEPVQADSPEAARRLIDDDQVAAAVIIPAGFTNSIIPAEGQQALSGEIINIELYANPTRPTSVGVIQTILEEFIARVETGRIGGQVAIMQMLQSGRLSLDQTSIEAAGRALGERVANANEESAISLKKAESGAEAVQFDVLAYMAPGMALMFLMFTVSYGGRSILAERALGTLPRLLVSPTHPAQILGGKVLGIFLTGVAQVGILILASTLLFQLNWGDPLGVVVLTLAAVFGATGWGMLLTAFARTPGQVSTIGSALMLTFGILGGSFIQVSQLHPAIQLLSRITPNAWGLDGFTTLALGGTLADIARPVMALVIMGALLFGVAVVMFGRKNLK